MSTRNPHLPLTLAAENARNHEVMRKLALIPACDLLRTATVAMRIHPDLAAPFAAASTINLVQRLNIIERRQP